MSERDRPFRVLGIAQVAIGCTDRKEPRKLWVDLLGAVPHSAFTSVTENVDEETLKLGAGAASFELDLMQPLDPTRKPRVDVPALNHIGLWVDDLRAAFAWLTDQGVHFAPGGIRKGAAGHDICFIHPRSAHAFPIGGSGVLIELIQAPPDVMRAGWEEI